MKKRLMQLFVIIIVITIASCGGNKKSSINQLPDLQGKVIGMMTTGISNKGVDNMIQGLIGCAPQKVVYFNRLIDGLTALKAGKIDAFPCHQFAADYLVKRNPDIKEISVNQNFEGGVIMAVRAEDMALKNQLDSAITVLKGNGVLNELEDKWITNLPADEPSNNEIPKIENANTIYVGICGDFPPLDYIAANGKPGGFNVALLSEIEKILNTNFEFVSLESMARFAALSSKKIDVIFCHFESNNTSYFNDLKSKNWVGTIPYFTYKSGSFIVKK